MANIIDNHLVVKARNHNTVVKFVNGLKENLNQPGNLSMFHTYLPVPQKLRGVGSPDGPNLSEEQLQQLEASTGFRSEYDWRVSESGWGNKWSDNDLRLKLGFKGALLIYNSANEPTSFAVWKLSRKFPSLTFELEWVDFGGNVAGEFAVKGGVILHDTFSAELNTRLALDLYGMVSYTEDGALVDVDGNEY